AGSGKRATIPGRHVFITPAFLLLHRIPGQQTTEGFTGWRLGVDQHAGVPANTAHWLPRLVATVLGPVFVFHEIERNVLRREVSQAGFRTVGHGMPVMS